MARKKINTKSSKPPFRSLDRKRYRHQAYFIKYTNECCPELKESLRSMTSDCVKLFGEIPNLSDDFDGNSELEMKIDQILFSALSNADSYPGCNWHLLSDKNPEVREVLEFEKNLNLDINRQFKSITLIEAGEFRNECAMESNSASDSILIDEIAYKFREKILSRLAKTNRPYISVLKKKSFLLESFRDFDQRFRDLLEQFWLQRSWLNLPAFRAIWDGSGILRQTQLSKNSIPKEFFEDIRKPNNSSIFSKQYPQDIEWFVEKIPLPVPFTFPVEVSISESFEDYHATAVEAYSKFIKNYLDAVKTALKNAGFKDTRGNTEDPAKVLWLVKWNASKCKSLWEILPEIPEFRDRDPNVENDINTAVDILRKALRRFEKLDLPLRPLPNSRKK